MSYYVFVNYEKERMAREAVKNKGDIGEKGFRVDPRDGSVNVAHITLYHKLKAKNPELDGEELVKEIYCGLGGLLEEYHDEDKAISRSERLREIRTKQAKRDAIF